MSRAAFVMGTADTAFPRVAKREDTTIGWRFVNPLMKQRYGVDSMPETAENVVADFGISRVEHEPRGVCHGYCRHRLPARRKARGHDDRLALRESSDETALRRGFNARDRGERRGRFRYF